MNIEKLLLFLIFKLLQKISYGLFPNCLSVHFFTFCIREMIFLVSSFFLIFQLIHINHICLFLVSFFLSRHVLALGSFFLSFFLSVPTIFHCLLSFLIISVFFFTLYFFIPSLSFSWFYFLFLSFLPSFSDTQLSSCCSCSLQAQILLVLFLSLSFLYSHFFINSLYFLYFH